MITGSLREFFFRWNVARARTRLNRNDGFKFFYDAEAIEEVVCLLRLLGMAPMFKNFPITADFAMSDESFGVPRTCDLADVNAHADGLLPSFDDMSGDEQVDSDEDDGTADEIGPLSGFSPSVQYLAQYEQSNLPVLDFDPKNNIAECQLFQKMRAEVNTMGVNRYGGRNWDEFAVEWNKRARDKAKADRGTNKTPTMFLKTTQMCERYYKRLQKKDEHTAAAGQHSAELLRTRSQYRSGVNVPPSFTQTAPLMSLGGDVTNTSTDTSFRHMSSVPPLPLMAANHGLTVVAPTPTSATTMPSAAAAQSLPTSLLPEAPAPMVVYAPARTGLTGPSTHLCLSAAPGENQFAADQSLLRRRKRRPKTCSVCGHIKHFGKFKEYHAAEGTNSERCDVPKTDHALPMDRYSGACKCVVCQALIAPLERDGHFTARLRRAASANVPSGTRRTTWLKQQSASSAAEANNAPSAIPAGSTPTLSSAPVPSGPLASSSVNSSSTTVTRSHVPSTPARPSPPVSVPIPMVAPSPPMSTRSARTRERVIAASPASSNSLPNHESPPSPSSPPHVPVYKPSRFRSVLTTDTMQVPSAGSEELQDEIDPADMLLLSTPVVLPPPMRRPGSVHVVPSSRPVLAKAASTHVHRKPTGLRMVTTTSTSQPARAPAAAINPIASASATRVRTQHTQAQGSPSRTSTARSPHQNSQRR
jgi:hypothetical protein